MAIDYQQILLDMNRPHRRQGKSMKTLLGAFFLMAAIFAGTFSAWKYGIVDKVTDNVRTMAANLFASGTEEAESVLAATSTEANAAEPAALRPANQAVPLQSGLPIDVAAVAKSTAPGKTAPAAAQGETSLRPVQTPASAPVSVPAPAPGSGMDAIPVLSDARAQLRVIDQALNSNPAEAMRRLDSLSRTALEPMEAAEVGYRRGYAARMLKDEALAERAWRETVGTYPGTRGGRFSALALADTWFQHYAGSRAQLSYWDDIQLMYSRVLGVDDAPFLPDAKRAEVKSRLGTLNDALFFGSAPTPLARYHRIEQGELLGSIAQKYRVDYESIARINGINPNQIRAGMDVKIVVGDVDIVVRKNMADPAKTPTVTWYLDGRWVREYPACVGDGVKTPSGTYSFTSKERDPSWTNPANGQLLPHDHPENILGSRWMAMKGMNTQGLGIHGTTIDDSIPGYTSAGCVRLLNRDVEELFSYARIGGRVTILD